MRVLRHIAHDGDFGLLVLFFFAGLIPAVADALAGRALGGEATIGALASVCSAWAMIGRIHTWRRTEALATVLLQKTGGVRGRSRLEADAVVRAPHHS